MIGAFAPKGNAMPINNDIVDIFKRRMPDLTSQEAQDIQDYFSKLDSGVAHFTGGDTLEIGNIESVRGNFQFPVLQSSSYTNAAPTYSAGVGTAVAWTIVRYETGGAGVLNKSDNTKIHVSPGSQGNQSWLFAITMKGPSDSWQVNLTFYDKDDSYVGVDTFINDSGAIISGVNILTIPAGVSYFKVFVIPTGNTPSAIDLAVISLSWND